jgi:hypothetical protein
LLDTTYKYCPPYTAPNKARRPKKNKRIKSSDLEVATEKKQSMQKKVKGTIGKVDGNLKRPLFLR